LTIPRYYHPDGLGSVHYLTDGSGTVTDHYEFHAFGDQWYSSGSTTNPLRFVGQLGYFAETDLPSGMNWTGLMKLGARYYDPSLGRFITQDPIGYAGGINLYAYVDDNPAFGVDPDGLGPWLPSSRCDLNGLMEWMLGPAEQVGPRFLESLGDSGVCWLTCMGIPQQCLQAGSVAGIQRAVRKHWEDIAKRYAARKGLKVPRRSSIFRTLLGIGQADAKLIGDVGAVYTAYQGLVCLIKCTSNDNEIVRSRRRAREEARHGAGPRAWRW